MRTRIFVFLSVLAGSQIWAQIPDAKVDGGTPPPSAAQSPADAPAAGGESTGVTSAVRKFDRKPSVVRVNVTNQAWDFLRPWGKHAPSSRRAVGAVLPDRRVLVTGELVANANYIEFEAPDGGVKIAASIDAVDYEANLAIVRSEDPRFMDAFEPVAFTTASVGDTLSVWQLENNGTLLVTNGSMTTAEVSRYPVDDSPLLVYRATAPLQFRDSSFTLPVVKGEKLVGLIMRFDNNTKSAEIVPTPVIEHFLKDAAKARYAGFPRAGLAFSNTRDPQFRRYIKLDSSNVGGVYVTSVLKDGSAEKAGVEIGDVILKIDGQSIDQDGNYLDPAYGKLSLTHLVGTRHFEGDTLKFSLLRNGAPKELDVCISHRGPESYVIEPYVLDRAPKFYVLGGLVLQELSRQFLKEWGADWGKKAPEEFVYMDNQQGEIYKGAETGAGRKVIILSGVLPSASTIGYEELRPMVLTRVNGMELANLSDLPAALAKATNGLHKIEFDGEPSTIYLDVEAVSAGDAALMQNFRIPVLKRLE